MDFFSSCVNVKDVGWMALLSLCKRQCDSAQVSAVCFALLFRDSVVQPSLRKDDTDLFIFYASRTFSRLRDMI